LNTPFTNGPWKISVDDTIVNIDQVLVAEVCGASDADKNLICAAPDLYNALAAIVEHHNGSVPITVLRQVDEALEKANGRTASLVSAMRP
jgi:hypothetical protein